MSNDTTSAGKQIDERIRELGDWRGKTLGKVRGIEGKVRRAIDFKENDKIDERALKDLIRAAVALNLKKGDS